MADDGEVRERAEEVLPHDVQDADTQQQQQLLCKLGHQWTIVGCVEYAHNHGFRTILSVHYCPPPSSPTWAPTMSCSPLTDPKLMNLPFIEWGEHDYMVYIYPRRRPRPPAHSTS